MFASVFAESSPLTKELALLVSFAIALVAGVLFSLLFSLKTSSTKNFMVATSLLPFAVTLVVALINGNIGIGIAIAGAFSLVRFRSAQGNAKEIAAIFITMSAGVAFGTGYLAIGVLFLLISGGLLYALTVLPIFEKKTEKAKRMVSITLPESLDYQVAFNEAFQKFTTHFEECKVKTTGMGSLYRVSYLVILKDENEEKALLDALRALNGNLEVSSSLVSDQQDYVL